MRIKLTRNNWRSAVGSLLTTLGVVSGAHGQEAALWSRPEGITAAQGDLVFDRQQKQISLVGSDANGRAGLWAWNGSAWRALEINPSLRPVRDVKPVYDEIQNKIALTDTSGDIWTWDGTVWSQRTFSKAPATTFFSLTFDAERSRWIRYGGSLFSMESKNQTVYPKTTWEWDGSVWQDTTLELSPIGRLSPFLMYDANRNKTVLFGGFYFPSDSYLNDTWEYDGQVWSRVLPSTPLPKSLAYGITYDGSRKKVVLLEGSPAKGGLWAWNGSTWDPIETTGPRPESTSVRLAYDEVQQKLIAIAGEGFTTTWQLDDTTWTQLDHGTPSPRSQHAIAYDATNETTLLLGKSNYDDDQWQGRGTAWSHQPAVPTPLKKREGHALAHDEVRQQVVLFGGVGSTKNSLQNDTWLWNGTAWEEAPGSVRPPPRRDHGLVFDAARKQVLLFGGETSFAAVLNDLWSWDGSAWSRLASLARPAARKRHGLVYDSLRQRVVLFGGFDTKNVALNDTWEWDGTDWKEQTPASKPAARGGHTLSFDRIRNKTILFSGRGITDANDLLWSWDGTTWQPIQNSGGPSPREATAAVFDIKNKNTLFFGGTEISQLDNVTPASQQDTWTLSLVAGACSAGDACASGYCVRGACCESACDKPETSCAEPGQEGRCVAVPPPSESATTTRCQDESTQVAADGSTENCGSYRCKESACLTRCSATTDCAGLGRCNASGKCVAPPVENDQGCGCKIEGQRQTSSFYNLRAYGFFLALGAWIFRRQRDERVTPKRSRQHLTRKLSAKIRPRRCPPDVATP